jgi:hypothetical protein
MEQSHIDRCNEIIPTIVKAFPGWDFEVHIPEESWTYQNFLKRDSAGGLVRFIVVEVVEGSEDASDEDFRDWCVEIVENAIGDLKSVQHAIENFSPRHPHDEIRVSMMQDDLLLDVDGDPIEIGDKVLIADSEERFEGTVVDRLFGGEKFDVLHTYTVECKYGTQDYDPEMVTLLEKGEPEDDEDGG